MIIRFKKKHACTDGLVCAEKIEKEIKKILPEYIQNKNGHLTIMHHTNKDHEVELVLYNQGRHEFMHNNKMIQQKFTHKHQKKYKGYLPESSEIKSCL